MQLSSMFYQLLNQYWIDESDKHVVAPVLVSYFSDDLRRLLPACFLMD